MDITKVLEILSKHIIKLEEDNQFKDLEIERLKKENSHLKDYVDEDMEDLWKKKKIKN